MSCFELCVEKMFDGEQVLLDQMITIENGKIKALEKNSSNIRVVKGMLVPGYIDVQVNGGGGYLFNQSPSIKTIEKIGKAHQQFGTTGWLPTLVTDSIEQMQKAANAVAEAIENKMPGILGIHFEGPFLSVIKKGVHSEELIRKISNIEFEILTRKDLGKVVVTLAPENVSPDQIKQLVKQGVIVCLGHSNATFEQTNFAIQAGATGFTHLFNAMSAFESREPGMVGAALMDKQSYAGLILDGIHVHPDSAKLAHNIKENLMLVTDAMPPVGSAEKSFDFFGGKVTRNGLTLTDSEGRLAGSALDMNTAVNNAIKMLSIDKCKANNLASKKPSEFLGLDKQYGKLQKGFYASMLLISDEGQVVTSWIDGKEVFNKLYKNN